MMRVLMRSVIVGGFIVFALIPVHAAPAQTELAPFITGDIQEWEGPHGTTTCHDLCGGDNCCP